MRNTDNTITDAERIRKLPWLIFYCTANSVWATLTVFGSVFILFLDQLGLPKGKIGLILSLFPFCGVIALFAAPRIAHFGLKRAFILFFGMRKFIAALLMLTPLVLANYGMQMAFRFVMLCMFVFAVCRSLGETAMYPWSREIVPNSVRGRYAAANNISTSVASALSLWLAAYYLNTHQGLSSFTTLMGIGFVFGLLGVWAVSFIPTNAHSGQSEAKHLGGMLEALRDRRFTRYLCGIACVLLAGGVASFLPLYMKEKIGLSESSIVLITISSLVATVATSYIWGWSADRYGSRAILLLSLGVVAVTYVIWAVAPRHTAQSLFAAAALSFVSGVFSTGYAMADGRMLYVTIIPEEKKTSYMAVFYAWIGIVGGAAPLIMGNLLDVGGSLSSSVGFIIVDGYTSLLVAAAGFAAIGVIVLRTVPSENDLSPGAFAGLLVRGNVLAAASSLVRHGRARDERDRVAVAELMGVAKSPLTTNELLKALNDPSQSVRHEALIAAAHSAIPEASVIAAVSKIAEGEEPELKVEAIWALGRMDAVEAAPQLREWLESAEPVVRSAAARALGVLCDEASKPVLIRVFHQEDDQNVRSACVSALGTLVAWEFTSEFLGYLQDCDTCHRRGVALAISRLFGGEQAFSRLWSSAMDDLGAALAAEVLTAKQYMTRNGMPTDMLDEIQDAAHALEQGDLINGINLLAGVARRDEWQSEDACGIVLRECSDRMLEYGDKRPEYAFLALGCLSKDG